MSETRQRIGLFLGPAIALLFQLMPVPSGLAEEAWMVAGIGLWMATWWMCESVPIPVTAFLPLILFPVLGIASMGTTAEPYANPLIFLFMGGFILALSMERCGLHKRISLMILRRVGTRPGPILGGFMIACAMMSMWVTNTAMTMMMLPIGMSVVALARQTMEKEDLDRFAPALMLAIAYACTIGGLGTLIGTVPNALMAGFMRETYGVEVGFVYWMMIGVPLVIVGLPVTWYLLTRVAFRIHGGEIPGLKELLHCELASMGRPGRDEIGVALTFGIVVFLWLGRPLLSGLVPGISDTGIAVMGALVLFLIPSAGKEGRPWKDRFLMDWESAVKLPWGILVLFGGGLALAAAIQDTGLAVWIGGLIAGVSVLPVILIVFVVTLVIVFLTELTSNTATTAAFLPVMALLAVGIGQDPFLLTIPATFAASCAFMLPVATPPNAIVFGSDLVTIPQMSKAGLLLNFAFTILVTVITYFLVQWVFGVQPGVVPPWAV